MTPEEPEEQKIVITDSGWLDFINSWDKDFRSKLVVVARNDWKIMLWCKLKTINWLRSLSGYVKPNCLDELEKSFIVLLRYHGFSMQDIAFVLDCSSSTVHEYCKTLPEKLKE